MEPFAPLALMLAGVVLATYGLTRRRPPGVPAHVQHRAGLRFLWDVTIGLLGVAAFAALTSRRRGQTTTTRTPGRTVR